MTKDMSHLLIDLTAIRKFCGGFEDEPSVEILHGIPLAINAGEFVARARPAPANRR
jgi:hypothetical protein